MHCLSSPRSSSESQPGGDHYAVPMGLRQLARDRPSLPAQDRLRAVLNRVERARRAAGVARGAGYAGAVALARRVSPAGVGARRPVKGLRLPVTTASGSTAPDLAETYEEELNQHLEAIITQQPRAIVDLGAGEGFYAVGLARRLPNAQERAFNIDAAARRLCTEIATRNDVADDEVVRTLLDRFSSSHDVTLVPFEARNLTGRPQLAHLSQDDRGAAMAEGLPSEPWPMHRAVGTPIGFVRAYPT